MWLESSIDIIRFQKIRIFFKKIFVVWQRYVISGELLRMTCNAQKKSLLANLKDNHFD